MKTIIVVCFNLAFLSMNCKCGAQDIKAANLQWNCSDFKDLITNVAVTRTCKFVTHGAKSIEWIQGSANQQVIYTLNVQSTDGAWSNIKLDGGLVFHVTLDQLSGIVSITKSKNSYILLLDLKGETGDIKNEYHVSSTENL
jgi:hypothetical protein